MNKRKFSTFLSLLFGIFAFVSLSLASIRSSKIVETHASEVTYETPDYISVSDLKQNGSYVGNKIVMNAQKKYKYERTAEYGSLVFTFTLRNTKWSVDDDGGQFHFYDGWQMHGAFWLRPDKLRIIHDPIVGTNKEPQYAVFDPITAGEHKIELGRLAIMEDGQYTHNQYFYMKVDDTLWGEYTIYDMDDKFIQGNTIFSTCTGGNVILDVNWEGSKVTYIANGEVYKEETTIDDYLTKPATDPVSEGKTFVGWFDEMGNEWNFAKDLARNNLVLRAGFKSDVAEIPDEQYFDDSTYTPVLRFMVASDVHIGTTTTRRDTNLANAIDHAYSFASANSKYSALDAALFAGDISDSGNIYELTSFKNTATAHLQSGTQLIASMGNHDYRSASPAESISNFASLFGPVDKHLVINGFHFITLSPDLSNGEHFSDDKVNWLDEQLAIAAEADPTKPIFVMQHEHIKGTVYGSEAWYVSELTDVICKYPQVVDFSGHSHYPLADPRSIWQGTFTALGTGTLHYYELGINGYRNTGIFPYGKTGEWHDGASEESKAAEYQIVEIDANNAIRVIAYDLMSNTEITRYYIRNVMDDVKFKYSQTERAKSSEAPVFASNANLTLTPVGSFVEVTFDQATCKDVVESYRIEIYNGSNLVRTEYLLSDYFYNPIPEQLSYKMRGLNSETEYNIKVYAVNVWNDVSAVPLTGTVTTNEFELGDEVYAEYDVVNLLDLDIPNNTGIFTNMVESSSMDYQYAYPGTADNITAVTSFYLITGDTITPEDEFRVTLGKVYDCYNAIWIQHQTGNAINKIFCGWRYSTRPSDRYDFNLEPNTIYKIEFGTLFVEEGEHMGEAFTFLRINGQKVMKNKSGEYLDGFYFPRSEYNNTQHTVALKVTSNYTIADISLGRNIQYMVDGEVYQEKLAISGLLTSAPVAPTKGNLYFAGWYTQPDGGRRVDFSKPFVSDGENPKLYARFTDSTYNVKLYSDGQLIDTKIVGKDCELEVPSDPVKTGQYEYVFTKWVIRGTDEEFDFSTRVNSDLELEAVFEERKFRVVYLVDGLEYETKYFVESDPQTIIGGEPSVPELIGATGKWSYQKERTTEDIYARAIYDGIATNPSNEISLDAFAGSSVDIADDLTRFYLSFADTNAQARWLEYYPVSGGHERQNISFSWTDSGSNPNYLVYFADNAEFKDAFIVKTDKKSIDYVGIFTPGKTYYWKVVGLNNEKWSAVDSFTVLDTPVRWISAGTVFNVRDLGGWTTTDGKVLNYGLIYRGAQLSLDQSGEKSYMDDYAFKVFDYLRMKTEIELRGDKPHELNQFNEFEQLINVKGGNYDGMFKLDDTAKQNYRDVFALLADINNYPVYFHCSWGADRTGSLGVLINGVLGVLPEQIVEDYELTSLSHTGTRTRNNFGDGAYSKMIKKFMDDYANGGTLQDAITNYLLNYIGVTQQQIDSLKSIMLSDATNQLVTHTVTYKIDGEIYQQSKVIDGEFIKNIVPIFYDKHLECWLLDGTPFDENTPIVSDITLEARFKNTIYDDYDIVTLRDIGLGESCIPSAGTYSFEGSTSSGGRMFVVDYTITAEDNNFDDGVHIEIGNQVWDCKAHIWIQSQTSIHIFVEGIGSDGSMHPIATYNRNLEYGKTYRLEVGVVIPLEGEYANKKMFVVLIDGEMVSFIQSQADITSNFNIGIAGTEGVLQSVENKKNVSFIGYDGNVVETKQVTRGQYVEELEASEVEGKVFLGWYDELGNIWNFETNKVLKDTKLFARYDYRSIEAMVLDENGLEIISGYKVRIGATVSEIEIPLVSSDNLEFDGWYNGNTKLNPTEIISENMNLICKFKVVQQEQPSENPSVEPSVEPISEPTSEPTSEASSIITPSENKSNETSDVIVDPEQPSKPKKGCRSDLSSDLSLLALAMLAGAAILKKKRDERC